MKLKVESKKRFVWSKSFVAASLAAVLMLPTAFAAAESASDGAGNAEPPVLNAESAEAFLDGLLQSEQLAPHYVGAAVVVVKDGEVIARKGYGYADKETQQAVDPASTVFRMASVSKSFTALAAMQLVEQGLLDLDADIRTHLPGIAFDNPFGVPVTVGHLLSHTTGFQIRDPLPSDLHHDWDKQVEIEDYVREHMPPVVREPGSSYMYDNFASLLVGLIVQKVSGMPFEDYMQQKVFDVLDMESSSFLVEGELKERLATEYDAALQPIEPYAVTPSVMPQGGMLSTADNIAKFMIAFLNEGKTDDGSQLLQSETVKEMTAYRSSIHPLLPDTTYGFEAPIQLPGAGSSTAVVGKAGDLLGTSTYLFMIPEHNTGVFIAYNQTGVLRNVLYSQFIATFFPQYAAAAELEPFAAESDEALERFAGHYSDLRISTFISRLATEGEGDLIIADAFLGPRPLKQVDSNLFVDNLTNQFTAFKLDKDGRVLYMKEPYINPLGYAQKAAAPAGFADLDDESPFAEAIKALQSLGYYDNASSESFMPEKPVTRAEFLKNVLVASNLKGSDSEELAFTDIDGHPEAAYIQQAYELGMIVGNGKGEFRPDRAIARQEAAVMLWRIYALQYPTELFDQVPLVENDTDEWAVQAVQMMAALGLHGPEVAMTEAGVAYHGKRAMNRQEEAALLYALLTSPTDQIVAALLQQGEAAPEAEAPEAEAPDAETPEAEAPEVEAPEASEVEATEAA